MKSEICPPGRGQKERKQADMDSLNDSLVGKQLGIYQVQALLGQGGMARVYKAYHPHLRREVAIKVIHAETADRAAFQARFKLEAQMIASLDHPHIVRIYDFGEEGELAYLVMQYVSGGTLRDQVRGKHPLEPQRATSYAIQMAQALHHAHQHGIIHRDVKPQNMLVSSTDRAQLLLSDFGIAKLYYENGEPNALADMPTREMADLELTSASQIIGTADYMAPEQARGQAVDARTDVYALGVVLFQMLTGDKPFHAASMHGLLVQHVATPAPWVSASNPRVPQVLAQITARALAKAPADRFQSAEEMANALSMVDRNATNPLSSSVSGSANAVANPPTSADRSTQWMSYPPATTNTSAQWTPQNSRPPIQTNPYATSPISRTPSSLTSLTGASVPATSPGITVGPPARAGRRPFSPGLLLVTAAVLVSLIVAGLHWFPALTGHQGNTLPTTSETAQAFHEQFQNNQRNWLVGNIASGVTLSTPGNGVYRVTVATNTTIFPYPQAVGLLPDAFTLTATLRQLAGAADDTYGLAFHFTQDSSGLVNCYALVIANNGTYEVLEYTGNHLATITSGSYRTGPGVHTLAVKARGNTYAFSIDQQALGITTGAQAPGTTWSNSDLHGGHLALLFAGPNAGEAATTFEATDVQLNIVPKI